MTTMSDGERKAFLADLGLPADGDPHLAAGITKQAKAKAKKEAKKVPVSTDPHTMPVGDIVFDADLLADFTLDSSDMTQASRLLFDMYKSPVKGDRNKLLHRRISEFLVQVKRERNPKPRDGFIKGKVKAGKEQRDLAQLMADADIDADDLAAMLETLAARKKAQADTTFS